MNNCCLLLIDDGRADYLQECRASLEQNLPHFAYEVLIDDSSHTLGFAGAIQEGWRRVLETGAEWVFHVESDFIFNSTIPLQRMSYVLADYPYIAQMALKRQAWSQEEINAGGIVEMDPDAYTENWDDEDLWTEHRKFFTTNPSIYSTSLCKIGWPDPSGSEGKFSDTIFRNPDVRSAFWGGMFDDPLCTHIGWRRDGSAHLY